MTVHTLSLTVYSSEDAADLSSVSPTRAVAWPGTRLVESHFPDGRRQVDVPTLEMQWLHPSGTGEEVTESVLNPMYSIEQLTDGSHELKLVLGDTVEDRVLADIAFNDDGWFGVGEPINTGAAESIQVMARRVT